MAKIKPKQAMSKVISDGFLGIGETAAGKIRTADVCNFRILSDGSLEKRCGWRITASFPDEMKAYWEGVLQGVSYRFAVSGDGVYRLDGTSPTKIGSLSDAESKVRFFSYREHLYLLDSHTIRIYDTSSQRFRGAQGYAPLYGYNWHPTELGAVNEPLNLLSNRLRVHYFNVTATSSFQLPFYASSVDRVRVDGVYVSSFSLQSDRHTLTVPSAANGSSIEVAFTASTGGTLREQLLQCTQCFCDLGEGQENLILYGSSNENLLFCTARMEDSMEMGALSEYSDSDPLYFTQNMLLTLGSPDSPIRSLYLNRGRILAFHEMGCFSLSRSTVGNLVESYALPISVGTTLCGAELYLEGDPVVIHRSGIFRLKSTASAPDDLVAIPLTNGIAELRTESFLENGIVGEDMAHGELWFCDPADEDGRVWIYQIATKQWVSFDNIAAKFFFNTSSGIGFARQDKLCVFDETLYTDNGAPFTATYQSGFVDFSSPEEPKRALRLTCCANSMGNSIDVTVQSEKRYDMKTLLGNRQILPEFFDLRFALGRFRFLQVSLTDMGDRRSRFYRLALFANS